MPGIRERDVHTTPTPRMGGLAMYGGLAAGLLVAAALPHNGAALADPSIANGHTVIALLVGGAMITFTGFLDDWWGMDPFIKLSGQTAAVATLVAFGLRLPWLPLPEVFGGGVLVLDDTLAVIVTLIITVIVVNAVNFIDGLDGLAAGIAGIAALAIWAYSIVLSVDQGDSRINVTAAVSSTLVGIAVGFLPHNFHPARIFMGDTGSMLLGLVLASSIVTIMPQLYSSHATTLNRFPVLLPLILPVGVLALPLLDLLVAVVRRTSRGRSPFTPDREHLHHRLLNLGHSHQRTVLIMYAWAALLAFSVVALSITGVPLIVFGVTMLVALALLAFMLSPPWRYHRVAEHRHHPHGRLRKRRLRTD